jgi:hypothetical protein
MRERQLKTGNIIMYENNMRVCRVVAQSKIFADPIVSPACYTIGSGKSGQNLLRKIEYLKIISSRR